MNPEFQRRIQRYGWDKAASHYDKGWQEQLWPAQKRLLEETTIQSGQSVLDIACGTGLVSFPVADLVGSYGQVTGVDISEKMIELASIQGKLRGYNNVRFEHSDAESLGFPDNHFDVVLCSLGLMYYPFPDKALMEMYRVLKSGGIASALVWGARKNCGWSEIFPITDLRVKSEVCPMFFQLGTGNSLQFSFDKVGFVKVNAVKFKTLLHFNDDEHACQAGFKGGPVALAFNKFDDKIKQEVIREYLKSIHGYKNGEGYHIPGEFVIAVGMKV